jgi:hypothetical protein
VHPRSDHPSPPAGALAVALAIAGCSAPTEREVDFTVRDTAIVVETDAPFSQSPDFPERVESTVEAALAYWGGDWTDLAGMTITFAGTRWVRCGGAESALGCYDGDIRVTTSDPGVGTLSCVEQTVLVHEVGHAVIGDHRHEDPRWMELQPVAEELSGRRGYGSSGDDVDCEIAVSVWRHPRHR